MEIKPERSPTEKDKSSFINPLINPKFWLTLGVGLVVILAAGLTVAGPTRTFEFIIKALRDPSTPVGIGGFFTGILVIVNAVNKTIKELKEKNSKTEAKAQANSIEIAETNRRTTELEGVVRQLLGANETLERSNIRLNAEMDEYQENRKRDKAEMDDARQEIKHLRESDQTKQRHIEDLQFQLRQMAQDKASDKALIQELQAKVAVLEIELAKSTIENMHLTERVRGTEDIQRRIGTGKLSLTGLPPDIQLEFDNLNIANSQMKKEGENQK